MRGKSHISSLAQAHAGNIGCHNSGDMVVVVPLGTHSMAIDTRQQQSVCSQQGTSPSPQFLETIGAAVVL